MAEGNGDNGKSRSSWLWKGPRVVSHGHVVQKLQPSDQQSGWRPSQRSAPTSKQLAGSDDANTDREWHETTKRYASGWQMTHLNGRSIRRE